MFPNWNWHDSGNAVVLSFLGVGPFLEDCPLFPTEYLKYLINRMTFLKSWINHRKLCQSWVNFEYLPGNAARSEIVWFQKSCSPFLNLHISVCAFLYFLRGTLKEKSLLFILKCFYPTCLPQASPKVACNKSPFTLRLNTLNIIWAIDQVSHSPFL